MKEAVGKRIDSVTSCESLSTAEEQQTGKVEVGGRLNCGQKGSGYKDRMGGRCSEVSMDAPQLRINGAKEGQGACQASAEDG